MANSGTAAKHIIKTFICFFASQYLMNDVCSWCVILHPFLWHTNSFPSLYNHVLCIKLDTLPTQPIPCMPTIFSEPPLPPPILYRPGPYTKMSCNNAELNLHVKAVFPPHQPLSLTRTHFHWVLNVFQCFVYFSHTMPTNAWTLSGCCFRSPWTSDDFCWTFLTPPPLHVCSSTAASRPSWSSGSAISESSTTSRWRSTPGRLSMRVWLLSRSWRWAATPNSSGRSTCTTTKPTTLR